MRNNIKFTIVIPTRDRVDTLVHTVRSALAQDHDNYEILISDNASEDNTSDLIASFNDSRIRYINTGDRVSMSHNWEFALSHVDDGWVTFLGDDDAILPGALVLAEKIINETGTLAIRSNGCAYTWPSLLKSDYGNLLVSLEKGYQRVRSEEALIKVMNGDLHYTWLPMLYNGGFINISLIKKAKEITNNFYLSMTPDVYSAMVFSLLTDEYIYSYEPLAINGASHHSGGTAGFEKKKLNRSYDPAQKYWNENNIPFHKSVPLLSNGKPVRSIAAHVYEAYLQAAPFHHLKTIDVSPRQQLELIIKTASPHTEEILDWSKVFAKQHQLNYEDAYKKAFSFTKLSAYKYKKFLQRTRSLISMFTVDGRSSLPLNNVYEASIVASVLKQYKPRVFERACTFFHRVISMILRVFRS